MTIKRRAASRIEVVAGQPPSDRYLAEAFAVAKTEDLAPEVRARVLPGFCRSAIEAACASAIRHRLIGQGVPHAEVEDRIAALTSLTTWLAAAFDLSPAQGKEVGDRVRALAGEEAQRTVRLISKGTHQLVHVDGTRLVAQTKALVKALEPA